MNIELKETGIGLNDIDDDIENMRKKELERRGPDVEYEVWFHLSQKERGSRESKIVGAVGLPPVLPCFPPRRVAMSV